MATPGVYRHRVSFHSCTILFSRGSERRSVVLPAPMQHGKAWSGTELIFLFTPTAMFSYKAVSQRREKWEENILGQSRKYFLYDWVLKPQTFPVCLARNYSIHSSGNSWIIFIIFTPHRLSPLPNSTLDALGSPPPSLFLLPNHLQLQAVT